MPGNGIIDDWLSTVFREQFVSVPLWAQLELLVLILLQGTSISSITCFSPAASCMALRTRALAGQGPNAEGDGGRGHCPSFEQSDPGFGWDITKALKPSPFGDGGCKNGEDGEWRKLW